MIANFDDAFALMLRHEGGYVNNPLDPGGRTNLGVTQKAWEAYVEHAVDEADMRALTPDVVKPFYKAKYWDKVRGDELPDGVDYAVFDLAVNSGVGRASKLLQSAVGVPADGMVGAKTLAAVNACNAADLAKDICDMRLNFLKSLSTFATFGKGWERRVVEVKDHAVAMT